MQIIRWQKQTPPTEQELREQMRREKLSPYIWSNDSHYTYAAHTRSYEKVLYCVEGSILVIAGTHTRFLLWGNATPFFFLVYCQRSFDKSYTYMVEYMYGQNDKSTTASDT